MDTQLARTLIGSYVGSADLGEAIATAQRVPAGDYATWYSEWDRTATTAEHAAESAAQKGLTVLAARGYLRASEYSRQSYFFLRQEPSDERVVRAYQRQRDLFQIAATYLPYSIEPISISFDPTPLNGYLYRPDATSDVPRPTILFPGGFDGTCEEMFKYGALGALEQGWNAVTWDGPGQGGQLIEHGVTMRPDFEIVLGAVIDWCLEKPFVQGDGLVVIGRSLGGYLGPRGVSRNPRVRALVADPGQFDFVSRFVDMFSAEDWEKVLTADPTMDQQLEGFLADERARASYGSRMAAMGAKSFGGWLRLLVDYSLKNLAGQISCPTLITEGEGDFASQSRKLFDALNCEKQYRNFSVAEGAGGHCEGMGQLLWQDTVFSWLVEQLKA
ncbi:MAG: alpha/beta fold hydrolase [Acidimicrobiales bacterium]